MSITRENFRPTRKPPYRGISRTSSIESQGPDGKIRGTVQQLVERYVTLGRDALREGDIVMAESFFQHAEHYRRLCATTRRNDTEPKVKQDVTEEESLEEEAASYASFNDHD